MSAYLRLGIPEHERAERDGGRGLGHRLPVLQNGSEREPGEQVEGREKREQVPGRVGGYAQNNQEHQARIQQHREQQAAGGTIAETKIEQNRDRDQEPFDRRSSETQTPGFEQT